MVSTKKDAGVVRRPPERDDEFFPFVIPGDKPFG